MATKSLNLKSLSGAALLGVAVLAASPSFAASENPCAAANLKKMDANQDGKVSKAEYLAAMGAIFDKAAGAKGYCTFEEAKAAIEEVSGYYHW